jgi:gliding motility-associated-like protein
LCQNNAVTFTNTSTVSVQPSTFFWNFGDGSSSTVMNPTHYYTIPGIYQAMLVTTDAVSCHDTAYHTIVVDSIPVLDFTLSDHNICTGQSITAAAQYTQLGSIGIAYNFGDGSTIGNTNPASHAYDLPGTYFVSLTGQYRICNEATKTDSVNVHPLPQVDLGRDTVICLHGDPLYISNLASGDPGNRFLWSTGDTTSTLKVVHDGMYSLRVTTKDDCTTKDEITVSKDCYIDIPNSFTPNGDGANDYFFPRQLLGKSMLRFTMQIFNRWGQIVFETNKTDGRGWDGKFNDKHQPTGVYIYKIDVVLKGDRQEQYTGNVTLLR